MSPSVRGGVAASKPARSVPGTSAPARSSTAPVPNTRRISSAGSVLWVTGAPSHGGDGTARAAPTPQDGAMSFRSEASTVDQGAHPDRWRALAVTQLAGFMSLLDVSIVNVALPSIQQGLGASVAQVQWVVSGYALTCGLVLVAGGRLGDALVRRRMVLVALAGFVLPS